MGFAEEYAGSVPAQLARALTELENARRGAHAGAGLGLADRRLMWLFNDRVPRTLREVAEALGLEQSTVNRQVNAALAEGLLVRFRQPGRSSRLLDATDEGQARFRRDVAWHLQLFDAALGQLAPEDAERFPGLVRQFVDAYVAAAHPEA